MNKCSRRSQQCDCRQVRAIANVPQALLRVCWCFNKGGIRDFAAL